MAGKDIYIGEMLEKLQGNILNIQIEMADTVSILSQMLTNTGLTKQQIVKSVTDLSAVAISSFGYKEVISQGENTYIADVNHVRVHGNGTDSAANIATWVGDLTDIVKVRFSGSVGAGSVSVSRNQPTFDVGDESQGGETFTTGQSVMYEFDTTALSGNVLLKATGGVVSNRVAVNYLVEYIKDDGTVVNPFTPIDGIVSYSSDSKIVVSNTAGRGFSTFEFDGISQWSEIKIMGELSGGKVYVIDDVLNILATSNDANVIDISKYNGQNIKLMYDFVSGNSIDSISFRYF